MAATIDPPRQSARCAAGALPVRCRCAAGALPVASRGAGCGCVVTRARPVGTREHPCASRGRPVASLDVTAGSGGASVGGAVCLLRWQVTHPTHYVPGRVGGVGYTPHHSGDSFRRGSRDTPPPSQDAPAASGGVLVASQGRTRPGARQGARWAQGKEAPPTVIPASGRSRGLGPPRSFRERCYERRTRTCAACHIGGARVRETGGPAG
jgi:hypothetical protein